MIRGRRGTPLVLDRSLSDLAYRCWPDGCPRDRTCCVGLIVEVSRREVRTIDALMDELAHRVPDLREHDGFANVFVDDPPGYLIEPRDDGVCPFLVRTRRHALCSIHSLALATGRSLAGVKPAACRHWPLLLDVERGRVTLTVQPAAVRMGCVAPRRELPGQPSVGEAFSAEVAELCRANGLAVELNEEDPAACGRRGAGSPSCPPSRTARPRGRGRCPSRRRTACGPRGTTARRR